MIMQPVSLRNWEIRVIRRQPAQARVFGSMLVSRWGMALILLFAQSPFKTTLTVPRAETSTVLKLFILIILS